MDTSITAGPSHCWLSLSWINDYGGVVKNLGGCYQFAHTAVHSLEHSIGLREARASKQLLQAFANWYHALDDADELFERGQLRFFQQPVQYFHRVKLLDAVCSLVGGFFDGAAGFVCGFFDCAASFAGSFFDVFDNQL